MLPLQLRTKQRMLLMLVNQEVTQTVIGAAIEVHKALGPGLLESAYEECLCYELEMQGMQFKRQVPLPVM